jgi:hypothetical protein
MNKNELTPGMYRLSRDVKNPNADRRCKGNSNWAAKEVWLKGWVFQIKRNDIALSDGKVIPSFVINRTPYIFNGHHPQPG